MQMMADRPKIRIVGQLAIPIPENVHDRAGESGEDTHDFRRGLATYVPRYNDRVELVACALAKLADCLHISMYVREAKELHRLSPEEASAPQATIPAGPIVLRNARAPWLTLGMVVGPRHLNNPSASRTPFAVTLTEWRAGPFEARTGRPLVSTIA